MREELYKDIVKKLQSINEIKHIALWNEDVAFIESDPAFDMPAVFVQFNEIEWRTLCKGVDTLYRGDGTVSLHIVTRWDEEEPCRDWGLSMAVRQKLQGLGGEFYHGVQLLKTLTNHDHEDIVENIDVYKVAFDYAV